MVTKYVNVPVQAHGNVLIIKHQTREQKRLKYYRLSMLAIAFIAFIALVAVILSHVPATQPTKQTNSELTKSASWEIEGTEIQHKVVLLPLLQESSEIPQQEMQSHEFTVTAYCACEKCCGSWASKRNGPVVGAAGTELIPGVSVAIDHSLFSFGTKFYDADGNIYVAADTGSGVNGYWIDIYMADHEQAKAWGKQTMVLSWN